MQPWVIGPLRGPQTGNPVVTPNPDSTFTDPIAKEPVHWEALHTFNPGGHCAQRQGVRACIAPKTTPAAMEIGMHTSRLGLAESDDGIHFTRRAEPVFYPATDDQKAREWPGGAEDPRIVEGEDGTYVLTYTQWNRKTYSVGIATSPDLTHWTKHGPAFLTAAGGKYAHLKYKSAGIVTRLDKDKGRLIAAKIDGKYWMYWGEGAIRLATSDDLMHWTPVEDAQRQAASNCCVRAPGHFDSTFPETGPPPVLTDNGIVVLYNGKNAGRRAAIPRIGPKRVRAPAKRCSTPRIPRTCSSRPTSRCSSPNCRTRRPGSTQREPRLPRAWSAFTTSGFCITGARIRWWRWPLRPRMAARRASI